MICGNLNSKSKLIFTYSRENYILFKVKSVIVLCLLLIKSLHKIL